MPKVVRVDESFSTGHGCAGTTTIASSNQGVDNVYANNKLIDVVGAPTVSHPFPPNPPCAPHTAQLNVGSATVFINGKNVGRHGDSADAGSMNEPSGVTVYAGP